MVLSCPFPAGIQAYCPYHQEIAAHVPACCSLCESRLEGKGVYSRQVRLPEIKKIKIRRFRCLGPDCGISISLLPSFCVPYKQYSAKIIESCLDSVLRCGESIRNWCARTINTDRSTAGNWVRQFGDGSGLLSTEGCVRLGIRQPGGSGDQAQRLWAGLRTWAGSAPVLYVVQPGLCRRVPFLGVFRLRL